MSFSSDVDAVIRGPWVKARIKDSILRKDTLFGLWSDWGENISGYNVLKSRNLYARNTSRTTYAPGGTLPRTANRQVDGLQHTWVLNVSTAVWDKWEVDQCGSPDERAELIAAYLDNAIVSLNEDLEGQIFASGTYGSTVLWEGLGTAIADNNINAAYGNQTRAAGSWYNSYVNTAAGAITKAKLDTALTTLQQDEKVKASDQLIITTTAILRTIIALYHDSERITSNMGPTELRGGFVAPYSYSGVPIVTGQNVTSGELFFLDSSDISIGIHSDWNFASRRVEGTDNYKTAVDNAVAAQLLVDNPRKHYRYQGAS